MVRDATGKETVERDGLIPLSKVSHVEVTQATKSGCLGEKTFYLTIGSSGGQVQIPIPNREKGVEVRHIVSEITQDR
jgi:hypothetical protein